MRPTAVPCLTSQIKAVHCSPQSAADQKSPKGPASVGSQNSTQWWSLLLAGASVEHPATRAGMPTDRSTATRMTAVPVQLPPFCTICWEDLQVNTRDMAHSRGVTTRRRREVQHNCTQLHSYTRRQQEANARRTTHAYYTLHAATPERQRSSMMQ